MGLDQYLIGRKHLWKDYKNPGKDRMEDGFRVSTVEVDLGYWRKHPDLHGYIVTTFAEGSDECQEIELDAGMVKRIIEAVNDRSLPHTEGFFFGASDPDAVVTSDGRTEQQEDIRILEAALKWLTATPELPPVFVDEGQLSKETLQMADSLQEVGMEIRQVNLNADFPTETRSLIYRASW